MRKILCFLCAPSQQPSVHVEANAGPYTCFICTEAMGDPPVTKKFSSPLFGVPALKKRSLSIFGERKVKGRIHRAHIHGCCHGSEGKDRSWALLTTQAVWKTVVITCRRCHSDSPLPHHPDHHHVVSDITIYACSFLQSNMNIDAEWYRTMLQLFLIVQL